MSPAEREGVHLRCTLSLTNQMQTFFYVGKIVFPFSLNRQEICKKQKRVLVRKYVRRLTVKGLSALTNDG